MRKWFFIGLITPLITFSCGLGAAEVEFTEDGKLVRPDPTEWIFVSSSATDTASEMAAARAEAKSEGKFNIIHIDPGDWAHFKQTGEFREGTVLTMSFYNMDGKDMGRPRLWASERVGMEVGVKDSTRFADGWGYFRFTGDEQTAEVFPSDRCFACHEAMAETDKVFTQLYAIFQQQK